MADQDQHQVKSRPKEKNNTIVIVCVYVFNDMANGKWQMANAIWRP